MPQSPDGRLDEVASDPAAPPLADTEAATSWRPLGPGEDPTPRIEAHSPPALAEQQDALLPVEQRRLALRLWGDALLLASDFAGAGRAYEHAIGLGDTAVASWLGLARARAHAGHLEASEAAYLAALASLESTQPGDAVTRGRLLRERGEVYLLMDRPEAAVRCLEAAVEAAPGMPEIQRLLDRAHALAEGDEARIERTADAVLLPLPPSRLWRDEVAPGLASLRARMPAPVARAFERVDGAIGAGTAFGLLALWIGLRILRKKGDLVVVLTYPDELDGLFSVRLSKRPGRYKRPASGHKIKPERGRSTALAHYMVSRETQFQRLIPRRYQVVVQGLLKDADSGEVLSERWEEQSVDVARGTPSRVEFDLCPRDCPVDVRVRWDKRPAKDVGVVAFGLPQTLRYAAHGQQRLRLPMGSHTIAVGCGDRVAECAVEVQSHHPTPVEIDLAKAERLVFKGCPPAVEPYLHGDLNGAARALQRDGHDRLAHILLARLHQEQGHIARAAEQLESAGNTLEAANLRESIADYDRAATLFERGGDIKRAADNYLAAGQHCKAGELYESVAAYEPAAECFREAGAHDALVAVLERQGRYFDAARTASEAGDRAGEIRLLQQVPRTEPGYPEACRRLVEAYEREGHADLAASKLEQYIAAAGPAGSDLALQSRLADLLVQSEEFERARDVLEALRDREPTYPNIATRIETVRKKLSGRHFGDSTPSSANTELISEKRYEIIEEIGRGGMGLIYRARDRRLGREVALKRLPENLRDHPKALQLFLNEAQAAARLNHPNIVTVYDTDQEDGTFFITMELLEGHPLNSILKQRGRIGPRDCARIGVQVAKGLAYAHARQVVHRDIKTANLFLTTGRVLKIMDFGLAKMMEEVRRGTTVIGGTPFYMAPEQATGENVGHLADIYALGVTLFELLTGSVPFPNGDIVYHHRHTAPPDPRSLADGIPDVLADLVLAMIEKEQENRVASAEAVEQQLEAYLASGGA